MKNFYTILLLSIITLTSAMAQSDDGNTTISNKGQITMTKEFANYKFYQNDRQIAWKEFNEIFAGNTYALNEYTKAKRNYTFSKLTGILGGLAVGWELGNVISGNDPNWFVSSVGAGFVVLSFPLDRKFKQHMTKALHSYNRKHNNTGSSVSVKEINLISNKNGLGLAVSF
ncbi:MAG: hypothetical protein CSA01_00360 [Bacteroidetes bacterium]|nr:MAG: hypothetical protein CSA01_00360 [Bacteroidota bacterium]